MKTAKNSRLMPRSIPPYIPQNCQIHTCKRNAVAYCETMYVFVCGYHRAEFCTKDGHRLANMCEGLQLCIDEMVHNEAANIAEAKRCRRNAQEFRRHLKRLTDTKRSPPFERTSDK